MPVPLTALVKMMGTTERGASDSVADMVPASSRSSAEIVWRSASWIVVDGSEMMHGRRPASFSADSNLESVWRSPALVARSYLVMTTTRGSSRFRQSWRWAWDKSKPAAAGPSDSCGAGEAPSLPDEPSVSSAGIHTSVQCGCLYGMLDLNIARVAATYQPTMPRTVVRRNRGCPAESDKTIRRPFSAASTAA